MPVRNSLVLDHFYIDTDADDFEALRKLLGVFGGIFNHKVQAVGDAWEGLYLYSRPGSYFEILRERREHSLGLCFSPANLLSVNPSLITSEIPLDWKILERRMANGTPWFDALSLNPNPFQPDTLFDAWIMKYHPRHVDCLEVPAPRSVDRFTSLRLSLGREHLPEIEKLSSWFPGQRSKNESGLQFDVPDRDGFRFVIDINLVEGNQRFHFRELKMKHCDPSRFAEFNDLRMNNFVLKREGEYLSLMRED